MKLRILAKDLPNCPKGRIFLETINGDVFHSMTDEEHINNTYTCHHFSKEQLALMDDFFIIVTQELVKKIKQKLK